MKINFSVGSRLRAPAHGPQTWPWWRLVSFSWVRLGQGINTATGRGRRIWAYTRWGAWDFNIHWPKSEELIALHQLAIDVNWCRLYGKDSPHRDCDAMIQKSLAKVLELAKKMSERNPA